MIKANPQNLNHLTLGRETTDYQIIFINNNKVCFHTIILLFKFMNECENSIAKLVLSFTNLWWKKSFCVKLSGTFFFIRRFDLFTQLIKLIKLFELNYHSNECRYPQPSFIGTLFKLMSKVLVFMLFILFIWNWRAEIGLRVKCFVYCCIERKRLCGQSKLVVS